MIRLLIFILSVIFLAGLLGSLAGIESLFRAEIFGVKIAMPAGVLLGALLFSAVFLVFGTSLVNHFTTMPARMRARREKQKQDRGVAALTRGLEAVAVGDPDDAEHHARIARRNLGEGSLTRLLTAQAADLSGDTETASASFAAMLEAPETEFLGLRGLYTQAMRDGDEEAARGYAERAFRLRSTADWAFQSVFDLALSRGGWGEARNALEIAVKNKNVAPDRGKRGQAALLTAAAYAASQSGDSKTALEEAEQALKSVPGFAPAAVLAAEIHKAAGQDKRGEKVLLQAYGVNPDRALASAYLVLWSDKTAEEKATGLNAFKKRNADAPATAYIAAWVHDFEGDHKAALEAMAPLLTQSAPAHDCAFMARVTGAAYGEAASRPWLERAAGAARDPDPGVDGVYDLTREGWATLVREYMDHGRLAPPPLEGVALGLPTEEIKRLAAPLAALAGPTAAETEPAPSAMDAINKAVSGSKPEPAADPGDSAQGASAEENSAADEALVLEAEAKVSVADGDGADNASQIADNDEGIETDPKIQEEDGEVINLSSADTTPPDEPGDATADGSDSNRQTGS